MNCSLHKSGYSWQSTWFRRTTWSEILRLRDTNLGNSNGRILIGQLIGGSFPLWCEFLAMAAPWRVELDEQIIVGLDGVLNKGASVIKLHKSIHTVQTTLHLERCLAQIEHIRAQGEPGETWQQFHSKKWISLSVQNGLHLKTDL